MHRMSIHFEIGLTHFHYIYKMKAAVFLLVSAILFTCGDTDYVESMAQSLTDYCVQLRDADPQPKPLAHYERLVIRTILHNGTLPINYRDV